MIDYSVEINGKNNNVTILPDNKVKLNGKTLSYTLESIDNKSSLIKIKNKVYEIVYEKVDKNTLNLFIDGKSFSTFTRTALEEKAIALIEKSGSKANHQFEMKAPMPGMVLKIGKKIGDSILKGDSMMILEAMKMENDIKAPVSGIVKNIYVKEGSPVEKNFLLFSIKE